MPKTPNHNYNVPEKGQDDWGTPLNENFRQYDRDIEIRDLDANKSDYQPKDGAKFLATDTGIVYEGNGDTWNASLVLGHYEVNDGDADTITIEVDGESGLTLNGPRTYKVPDGPTVTGSGNVVAGHLNEAKPAPENELGHVTGAVVAGGGLFDEDEDASLGNVVKYNYGTISGGFGNECGFAASIGGGWNNSAIHSGSTVAGGHGNDVSGDFGTIGGGGYNKIDGKLATVAGGGGEKESEGNTASGDYATVGGGQNNEASGAEATVGGGDDNIAGGEKGLVGGGGGNEATAPFATVGGGEDNVADKRHTTVSGGQNNKASGQFATVAGGLDNTARGEYSFATGRNATADHNGAFVVGDSSDTEMVSQGADEARFQVPVYAPSVNETSAKTAKTNFESIDPTTVLEGVKSLDVSTWEFRTRDDGRHIGPMAGEFYETFGLGDDDGTIGTVDRGGVALAAIQGLSEVIEEKDERIEALESENEKLRQRVAAIEDHLGVK